MKIVTLGTSAGRPTIERSASATALEFEGEVFLFDCGEGTQVQLAKSTLHWGNIKVIFISHLHGDHIHGLAGLLGTLSLQDREAPLKVFGPPGIKKYMAVMLELKTSWIRYPLEITEIRAPGIILENKKYFIECAKLSHVIECWGYAFREKTRPGIFNEEKAKALNIPFGPIRKQIVEGKTVTLENGQIIKPEELLGPPRPGRNVAHCLDTQPCRSDLYLAENADVLIHESTFDHSLHDKVKDWGHSTSCQAASIARQANVHQLLLTHISPRYGNGRQLLEEARTEFKNTKMSQDLFEFEVPYKE